MTSATKKRTGEKTTSTITTITTQHHHQWIYQETADDISDLLGINIPQIKIVGLDLDVGEEVDEYDEYNGQHSKGLAHKTEQKIITRSTRSLWRALSINSTRFTVAYELLHSKISKSTTCC
jgi:hypothetical protein